VSGANGALGSQIPVLRTGAEHQCAVVRSTTAQTVPVCRPSLQTESAAAAQPPPQCVSVGLGQPFESCPRSGQLERAGARVAI